MKSYADRENCDSRSCWISAQTDPLIRSGLLIFINADSSTITLINYDLEIIASKLFD
jgi:hypothetical protein